MATSSTPTAVDSRQYHHFIPRLTLRNFSAEPKARDPKINVIDLTSGAIEQKPLAKAFGLVDMYRDDRSPKHYHIEQKLSNVEKAAGRIIAKAREAFEDGPAAELELTRPERNTLRKFLFLMKYRNMIFFHKYNGKPMEDWQRKEAAMVKQHMIDRGLANLREVWLTNLLAFVDADVEQPGLLGRLTKKGAFAPDAKLFELHVKTKYIVFCRPEDADQEFLVTENAYGVFEGPNQPGVLHTEWHNFAPLSPKLLILLRHNLLNDDLVEVTRVREIGYELHRNKHLSPENARSLFEDLSVQRPRPSYCTAVDGKLVLNPGTERTSLKDNFTFTCHRLSATNVHAINGVLLDEASQTKLITFKTPEAAACTIRTYLEDNIHSYVYEDNPMYPQVLRDALGWLDPVGGGRLKRVPTHIDYNGHWARWAGQHLAIELWQNSPVQKKIYALLSNDQSLLLFQYDVDQASRMVYLFIKCDVISAQNDFDKPLRIRIKTLLDDVFREGPLHRYWLFRKILRNLDKLDPEDFCTQLSPFQLAGDEDREIMGRLVFDSRG